MPAKRDDRTDRPQGDFDPILPIKAAPLGGRKARPACGGHEPSLRGYGDGRTRRAARIRPKAWIVASGIAVRDDPQGPTGLGVASCSGIAVAL